MIARQRAHAKAARDAHHPLPLQAGGSLAQSWLTSHSARIPLWRTVDHKIPSIRCVLARNGTHA